MSGARALQVNPLQVEMVSPSGGNVAAQEI